MKLMFDLSEEAKQRIADQLQKILLESAPYKLNLQVKKINLADGTVELSFGVNGKDFVLIEEHTKVLDEGDTITIMDLTNFVRVIIK